VEEHQRYAVGAKVSFKPVFSNPTLILLERAISSAE